MAEREVSGVVKAVAGQPNQFKDVWSFGVQLENAAGAAWHNARAASAEEAARVLAGIAVGMKVAVVEESSDDGRHWNVKGWRGVNGGESQKTIPESVAKETAGAAAESVKERYWRERERRITRLSCVNSSVQLHVAMLEANLQVPHATVEEVVESVLKVAKKFEKHAYGEAD